MTHPFNRQFWQLSNLRQTWEYKTLAFILRAIIAIVVVLYTLLAAGGLWEWSKRAYVRHQPITQADRLLETARGTGDFTPLVSWLSRRPRSEVTHHAQWVEDNISDVPFILLSYPLQAASLRNDTDDLIFWQMLGRYRLRYDLVRCGNPILLDKAATLMRAFAPFQSGYDEVIAVENDPQRLAKILQDVLAYDATHPARNDPRHTCESFKGLTEVKGTPMPREDWANARHVLRLVTERSIAEMQATTSEDTPAAGTPAE